VRLRRLEPVVRRAFREECAPFRSTHVLVAASGGADSTALLVALARLAPELGITLSAAHLDHRLRGADARADHAFVAALCGGLGVPLIAGAWDTRRRMRRRGLAGQDGLRRLRREFLAGAARRAGAAAIATAHTADDQLETVLMRLGRGAGLAGLGGIQARRGRWIRPLLRATRRDVEADLRRAGIEWREDASNADPAYLRARVRHRVIPSLLEALDPSHGPDIASSRDGRARAALARRVAGAAFQAQAAQRLVERRARGLLSRIGRIQGGEIALDSTGWHSYAYPVRLSVLQLLWSRLRPTPDGLTRAHLEALEALARSPRGIGRVDLPGGRIAERNGGVLTLRGSAEAATRARR